MVTEPKKWKMKKMKTMNRPDYCKQKSADSLYNLYKWWGLQTPLEMFQKIPQKFHVKTVQSDILWLNLNKINGISFLQSAYKQGNPSFHFHAPGSKHRYPCTQTASAVPKYFPCLLQFCTDYRIWYASRAWKRKTAKNVHFHITKNIQTQSTPFRYF